MFNGGKLNLFQGNVKDDFEVDQQVYSVKATFQVISSFANATEEYCAESIDFKEVYSTTLIWKKDKFFYKAYGLKPPKKTTKLTKIKLMTRLADGTHWNCS